MATHLLNKFNKPSVLKPVETRMARERSLYSLIQHPGWNPSDQSVTDQFIIPRNVSVFSSSSGCHNICIPYYF